jgi:hypothetical protein
LVPAWATKGWLKVLSAEFPTLAFHASINKSFGKVPSLWIDDFMFHGSAGELRVCQGDDLFRTCGTHIFYLKLYLSPNFYFVSIALEEVTDCILACLQASSQR